MVALSLPLPTRPALVRRVAPARSFPHPPLPFPPPPKHLSPGSFPRLACVAKGCSILGREPQSANTQLTAHPRSLSPSPQIRSSTGPENPSGFSPVTFRQNNILPTTDPPCTYTTAQTQRKDCWIWRLKSSSIRIRSNNMNQQPRSRRNHWQGLATGENLVSSFSSHFYISSSNRNIG